jgi:acetyl-CoA C-acetyltransferase
MNKRYTYLTSVEPRKFWEGYLITPKLGAAAIKGALDKINLDPNLIDVIYFDDKFFVRTKLLQGNALYAGLSNSVACTTPYPILAGMKAVMLSAQTMLTLMLRGMV